MALATTEDVARLARLSINTHLGDDTRAAVGSFLLLLDRGHPSAVINGFPVLAR